MEALLGELDDLGDVKGVSGVLKYIEGHTYLGRMLPHLRNTLAARAGTTTRPAKTANGSELSLKRILHRLEEDLAHVIGHAPEKSTTIGGMSNKYYIPTPKIGQTPATRLKPGVSEIQT